MTEVDWKAESLSRASYFILGGDNYTLLVSHHVICTYDR